MTNVYYIYFMGEVVNFIEYNKVINFLQIKLF